MKTVIVDDEQDAVLTLELIIQEYFSELNIVGKFTDPEKALTLIPLLKPDLIFLDINMPGMNGFELLHNLKNKDFHIVFTTAYDEYALKAFKYNAVDYLLKPIDVEELVTTINRLKTRISTNHSSNVDYRKLLYDMSSQNDEKLAFPTVEGIYFIKPSEILYFLASGSYTKVIRTEGDIIFVSKTLKDFENKIGPAFYRVHNSYIINLKYVSMLLKIDGWSVLMENGDKIPISRKKRMDIGNLVSRIAGGLIE
jgi:two-component system LytT family response regulator